jgi:drug/metabolite transporter (DMT)-like permease
MLDGMTAAPAAPEASGSARPVAVGVAVAGIVGTVAAAFLTWTVSGAATRNSFASVRTARLLDSGDHAAVSALLGIWYAVPALAAATVLALVLGRRRWAGAGAIVVGVLAIALAGAVLAAPIAHGAGPVVALATGVAALAGGVALARSARPARS